VIFKLLMAIITGASGWWIWQSASRWKAKGEVPSEWNEGPGSLHFEPGKITPFIFFQMALAGLFWLFCLLCIVSLIFFPELPA
jgi:hypothetical protein